MGIGFLTWKLDAGAVKGALEYEPRAVMLSFGDPGPYVDVIRRAGAILMIQVTDLDEARRALDLGVDVIVAQGTEAGGHGARQGGPHYRSCRSWWTSWRRCRSWPPGASPTAEGWLRRWSWVRPAP